MKVDATPIVIGLATPVTLVLSAYGQETSGASTSNLSFRVKSCPNAPPIKCLTPKLGFEAWRF